MKWKTEIVQNFGTSIMNRFETQSFQNKKYPVDVAWENIFKNLLTAVH